MEFISRVVRKVGWAAFKLVLRCILHLLLIVCVERLVSRFKCGSLSLAECASSLWEANRASSFCGSRNAKAIIHALRIGRYVIDGSKLCGHQTTLCLSLFKEGQLVVLCFDLFNSVLILLSELLVLVCLDTDGRRLNVRVVCALGAFGIINHLRSLVIVIVLVLWIVTF